MKLRGPTFIHTENVTGTRSKQVYGFREGSRDSAVGIVIGYGLNDREVGVRVSVGTRIFSSQRQDRLCGPHPSLLYNGYRELFPRG
jgi:hypothetical protein